MAQEIVRLNDLLSALSYALDLTEGQPEGHCIRCCYIGMHIGRAFGIDEETLNDLYYTLLLKDLGCSSNAARICSLYMADDLSFKRDFKLVNGSLPQVLHFALNSTGMQAGMATRFRTLYNIVKGGGELPKSLIETRCQRGADIALKMRFSQQVADGILQLDEHWDGSGLPMHLKGESIHDFSQIALMSQVIDVFHQQAGVEAALTEVKSRSGGWFNPALVSAFTFVAQDARFWQGLADDNLREIILSDKVAQKQWIISENHIDDIAAAFAQVIDAKSPFTAGHSDRVTIFTDLIAQQLGYSEKKRRWLRRAALLHDIGKLGVSNSVLDKPDKLSNEEFEKIKMHPVYSKSILDRIEIFSDIAPIAGGHHEKLNGRGYPNGLKGDEISLDVRIVTVADIFDALTADRPYRSAMSEAKALSIMHAMAVEEIDMMCLTALSDALSEFRKMAA